MRTDTLVFSPVLDCPQLVPPAVFNKIQSWQGQTPVAAIKVAEIDPAFCGGEDLCAHYGVDPSHGATCLIVEARRGTAKSYCACLAPVGYKMDLSGRLRKHLGARMVSLAPLDFVLETTGMEHGSVTPVGLPETWRIFLDPALLGLEHLIIGGGLRCSKLQLPTTALLDLPGTEPLEGLAKAA